MKTRIYLETSVIGAYLDNGDPFRRDLTIRWWEHERPRYDAFIAPLVIRELERVPEPRRSSYLRLVRDIPQLAVTEEVGILAEGYLSRGIFQRKFMADAVHMALASFHQVDFLVTWNFGYLANIYRQARVKMFNIAAGFFVPQVITPEFLVDQVW
ncbi:MAG: type II toxin-antitoxin system VapC family toxin [Acidobacteriota bacterium]|nr:type II toxin-antitoxin system VapC family toxin [Blastocatellia bacterium]MDW8241055.1 type II toxin-antitoxin system VapC family toxin [Acidobacteriota bacterium]